MPCERSGSQVMPTVWAPEDQARGPENQVRSPDDRGALRLAQGEFAQAAAGDQDRFEDEST